MEKRASREPEWAPVTQMRNQDSLRSSGCCRVALQSTYTEQHDGIMWRDQIARICAELLELCRTAGRRSGITKATAYQDTRTLKIAEVRAVARVCLRRTSVECGREGKVVGDQMSQSGWLVKAMCSPQLTLFLPRTRSTSLTHTR